jgi:hypothetical protein
VGVLILAESRDASALWLADRLRPRLTSAVDVVTPLQLVCSPRMVHRLATTACSFEFRLADGRMLDSAAIDGVVNRMLAAPTAHLQRAAAADRTYAVGELHAFLLGWLGSLDCPILNPPQPDCLVGPWRPQMEVLQLAAQAGLPFAARDIGEDPTPDGPAAGGTSFVLDGQVLGAPRPPALRDALLRFAALWGGRLLQVDFDAGPEGPALRGATSFVDFRAGGDLLVRAIARVLAA